MTKEQAIAWLRNNKDRGYLSISRIAKDSGVSNLAKIVDGKPDGRGYPSLLADKHLNKLVSIIQDIQKG